MKLKSLRIVNFRCCKDVTIEFGSMHALVGANNAGKSTILRALDFLLNPSATKISEESFWHKDTSLEIRIEGLFVDLTDEEKAALAPCPRPDGAFHLARTISYGARADEEEDSAEKVGIGQYYNAPQPRHEWLCEGHVTLKRIGEWLKEPDTLIANGRSFYEYLGGKKQVGEWKAKAAEFVAANLQADDFVDTWLPNPKGFPNVLKSHLPHLELIPAVKDASDESKVLKTNPFGRLIHHIVKSMASGLRDDISAKLKETTRRLNREAEADRLSEITAIEDSMKAYLGEMMPADLEIEFQSPTVETLLTTPRIFINDGFRGAIDGKGHGLQRAVIFSILRSYAKLMTKRSDVDTRPLILAIEEPELYMHPTAQRTIRKMFRTIADGGDQVVFSTHSPLLVDVAFFDEIVRVESADNNERIGAIVHQLPVQKMVEDCENRLPKLIGKVTPESLRERYGHAYTATRNEGFFAKQVILVEGQTESYCLPIYARALGHDFDSMSLAVIECGGKDQIDRLYRIFNSLGIACYVLFDYDRSNKDSESAKASKALLELFGSTDEPRDQPLITESFACFIETWEKDVNSQIPDYASLSADATKFLGTCGKPVTARYVATKLTDGQVPFVPSVLKDIIERAVKVKRGTSCLRLDHESLNTDRQRTSAAATE